MHAVAVIVEHLLKLVLIKLNVKTQQPGMHYHVVTLVVSQQLFMEVE